MKIEIKHTLNADFPTGIESTTKTWKLFGIVIIRKIYNYPKSKESDPFYTSRASLV